LPVAGRLAQRYPCDRFVQAPSVGCFRAATASADASEVFRWFCQLKIAPYSYDLVDNFGRRSPRTLSPQLEQLEVGQTFASIFELVDFTPGEQLTLRISDPKARRLFGDLAITYTVRQFGAGRSRLVVKIALAITPGRVSAVYRYLLVWGDLLMMRRQLRTLTRLASHSPA
jgi:hypothetical protein